MLQASVHGVEMGAMLALVAVAMGCTALPESMRKIAPAVSSYFAKKRASRFPLLARTPLFRREQKCA
ncbi:hypothetical protein CBM2586_B130548 [Cupriavidus phytorum]|uniref:Uncharacterized protein n=1 Tax=Cupriavidus taiwanensis TaxID=164546 RepID=A0A975XIS7_9BURK|nr:hypothetical protein CBM2586_B130548 [Cupriavidus taiwanensis]